MATLGERIKEFRKNKHLTQRDLGKKVSLTAQVISNYERGYSTPSAEDINRIASALDVDVSDLYAKKNSALSSHKYYDLTDKDRNDIGIQVDRMLAGLSSDAETNYYGEPMSPEDKEKMRVAMIAALEAAQVEARKRFTPKKYRKDDKE
ncbi:MAG: helix-turn-helix transcriptional regulator [Lentilactobacillus hilgardii]|uniref:helix-turn-helix domain-containing protein n=1 Tax=Lentilactobacillus hilgardii TaxID=1588 RepID=UPI0039EB2767